MADRIVYEEVSNLSEYTRLFGNPFDRIPSGTFEEEEGVSTFRTETGGREAIVGLSTDNTSTVIVLRGITPSEIAFEEILIRPRPVRKSF